MNSEDFKKAGNEALDYLADYIDSIKERFPIPNVKPGFAKENIPLKAPENGDKFENIMQDLENHIMPGAAHWIHPNYHAYFPTGASNASLLGVLLSGALSSSGDFWSTCPASTELEMIVLDWITKMYGLPEKFLFFKEDSKGGAAFQGSASECSLMCLFAAQRLSLQKLKKQYPSEEESTLLSRQVAYSSKLAHSSIEKACMIAMVNLKKLDTDDKFQVHGKTLEEAIQNDINNGLYPFYCCGTFGTTGSASCDKFNELGPICKKYDMWFHIDGAYAINSLVCPEFRNLAEGFEYASSMNTNASKWMLTHFEASMMWVEDRVHFAKTFAVDPNSVDENPKNLTIDYYNWGTSDSRRFRALKMWFVIRNYGIEGLQGFIRNHVQLAQRFAQMVSEDKRFEVISVNFGLVCFRLKGSNEATKTLLTAITASRKIFMVPASLNDIYVIRYTVANEHASEDDLKYAWEVIQSFTNELDLNK